MNRDDVKYTVMAVAIASAVTASSLEIGAHRFNKQFVPVYTTGMDKEQLELLERWME